VRPNVLLIVAHDVGRHLGCYGVPETGSNHLDGLAAGGVRLAQFFSTSPQCSPARASLVTGRYPHSHGVIGICSPIFGFDLHADERTLGQLLGDAGYRTALVGIQHETLHTERLGFEDHLAHHRPPPK